MVEHFEFCSEFYEVVKTIDVVAPFASGDRMVRFEVLHCEHTSKYSARAYLREDLTLQPTYPQENSQFTRKPQTFHMFVDWLDFPWTSSDTAEGALRSALSFLRQRVKPSAA